MTIHQRVYYQANAPAFARDLLKFDPDPVQLRLLEKSPSRCILNCTRQWGKSTITAIKALHNALFTPKSLTIIVSPSERQSGEFLRKVAELALTAGYKTRGDGKNRHSLLFANKSRIIGLPSSESTVRGFSGVSLLLIDEASRVPDQLYRAVRPMIAVSGGDLWLISTPYGRRGFFYETWHSSDPEWLRISVPATSCPRIQPEFLAKERLELGEFAFRQEYLCEFHDSDDQLLSQAVIERALSQNVKSLNIAPPVQNHIPAFRPSSPSDPALPEQLLRSKLYLGIDFGQAHDFTAIAVLEKSWWLTGARNHWNYERTREERFAVRHLERLPLGTPYSDAVTRVGRIVRSMPSNSNLWLSADATGVGRPVVEMIRKLGTGCMLYPVNITSGNRESYDGFYHYVPKSHLIGNLIFQFENGFFKVASDLQLSATLLNELTSLRLNVSNAGNEIYSTWRSNQHDDLLFAVALANWQAIKDKWYEPQQRLF